MAFGGGNYQVVWADDRAGSSATASLPPRARSSTGGRRRRSGSPAASVGSPRISAAGAAFYVGWEQFSSDGTFVRGSRASTHPPFSTRRAWVSPLGQRRIRPFGRIGRSNYFVAWQDNRGGGAPSSVRAWTGRPSFAGPFGLLLSPEGRTNRARPSRSTAPSTWSSGWTPAPAWPSTERVSTGGTVVDPGGLRLYGSPTADRRAIPSRPTAPTGSSPGPTAERRHDGLRHLRRPRQRAAARPRWRRGVAVCVNSANQVNPRVSYGGASTW